MHHKRITGIKKLKDVTKQHFGKQILQRKKTRTREKKSFWSGILRV